MLGKNMPMSPIWRPPCVVGPALPLWPGKPCIAACPEGPSPAVAGHVVAISITIPSEISLAHIGLTQRLQCFRTSLVDQTVRLIASPTVRLTNSRSLAR